MPIRLSFNKISNVLNLVRFNAIEETFVLLVPLILLSFDIHRVNELLLPLRSLQILYFLVQIVHPMLLLLLLIHSQALEHLISQVLVHLQSFIACRLLFYLGQLLIKLLLVLGQLSIHVLQLFEQVLFICGLALEGL
jgi:hypothetical protein